MNADLLTIILTLKGRDLHTLRWLWHANRTNFPFPILIADGQVNETVAKIIEDGKHFPNLKLRYERYADLSFSDFYNKCHDAISKVDTPYVMMNDNDDFIFPSGVLQSIDYLEKNKEAIASGARIAGFSIEANDDETLNNLTGRLSQISTQYSPNYNPRSHDASLASDRTVKQLKDYSIIYYHVCRKEALQQTTKEIAEFDFTDLEIHEMYWSLRLLTLGKAHTDSDCYFYFRQYGTSAGNAFSVDWVHHLLRSNFTNDFKAMVQRIAAEVGQTEKIDVEAFQEEITERYGDGLRLSLKRRYGGRRLPQPVIDVIKVLWRAFKRIRDAVQQSAPAMQKRKEALLSHTNPSYSDNAQELAEIEQTLAGTGFLDFIKNVAPELLENNT